MGRAATTIVPNEIKRSNYTNRGDGYLVLFEDGSIDLVQSPPGGYRRKPNKWQGHIPLAGEDEETDNSVEAAVYLQ